MGVVNGFRGFGWPSRNVDDQALQAPKGARKMRDQGKSVLLMAGLAVVAVVVAPTADARPNCNQTNRTEVCETDGHASIKTAPGTVSNPTGARGQIPWQTGGRRTYGGRR